MDQRNRRTQALIGIWLSLLTTTALAFKTVDVVKIDLVPIIRQAAPIPTQFAVPVPHEVSTRSSGTWTTQGDLSTWYYSVQVPTAISLSFHADQISLPPSARLQVQGASSFTYTARDIRRGSLWSRITPGSTLNFTLTVATAEKSHVKLAIHSLQVGYRSLGGGVPDHPLYRLLKERAASSTPSSCVQNYQCSVSSANAPAAAATVALVIENQFQCTGSLLNDVPGDNAPYILTARHCQTGRLGGGNPAVASAVSVYWDAVTPCGQALGSIYDTGTKTQTGASTVVEQQDAWLILLDDSPIVSDAQLVGFDASGHAVQNGYSIQYALGNDKQFTEWFGQALAVQQTGVLGVQYSSNFLEVVSQLGNIGPGASGSALVDQNNHLVGSLSLGRHSSDSVGYESCPASPPMAPNGSNGAADFTALAAVWNSTADTTSSTGTATLKSILDPGNIGTLVTASVPAATMTFTSSSYSLSEGASAVLSWNAAGATQCLAGAGSSGDGWTGVLPASGQQTISEPVAAGTLYSITCTLSGNRTVKASLTVVWGSPVPDVQFSATFATWTTRPTTLTWTATVAPCAISGGGFSASNLPSSGSVITTQSTPGDAQYQINCGTGNNQILSFANTTFVTPSLTFTANGTDRLLGQPLNLRWQSWADTCIPSGGAANDGWTSTAFPNPGFSLSYTPNVTTVGNYTYTLSCTSGPISITDSLQITVENNAPYVTLSIDRPSYVVTGTSSDGFTLTWNSNLSSCYPSATPILGGFISTLDPQGTATVTPDVGSYDFYVTCDPYNTNVGEVISASVPGTVLAPPPPTVSISIGPTTVYGNESFAVTWKATNSIGCTTSGGVYPGSAQGWAVFLAPSGTESFTAPAPGTYTFGISCGSPAHSVPAANAQATVTVLAGTPPPAPSVTLSSSPTTVTEGQSFTLTWSSSNSTGCTASGGGADGGSWSGALATSGSLTQAATSTGSFTYSVACTGPTSPSAQAQIIVTVSAPTAAGGKSGGGRSDIALLAGLSILLAIQVRRSQSRASAKRQSRFVHFITLRSEPHVRR